MEGASHITGEADSENSAKRASIGLDNSKCLGAISWLAQHTGSKIESSAGGVLSGYEIDSPYFSQTISYPVPGDLAETDRTKKNKYVEVIKGRGDKDSLFRFFMDGSRMAYKVAEFRKDGKVWPIVAGQIGIAYCERVGRQMRRGQRLYKNILSVPSRICGLSGSTADQLRTLDELRKEVNNRIGWNRRVEFDRIITYDEEKDKDATNLAISRIQALMVATEKQAISELANSGKLQDGMYLVKDGSLEYRDDPLSEIRWRNMEGRLKYVIGVSKSFNPDLFRIKVKTTNQSAAAFIAALPFGFRTQAFHYSLQRNAPPHFAVWYLRIRKPKLTRSIFDGILKVEMHLVSKTQEDFGLESDVIDRISGQLLREAIPVCYGADDRWASHIYPVFVTERFLKSGFYPENIFRSLAR